MKSAIFFAVLNGVTFAAALLVQGISPELAGIIGASFAALTIVGFAWATWSGERAAKRWIAQSRAECRAERIIRAARRGSYGH